MLFAKNYQIIHPCQLSKDGTFLLRQCMYYHAECYSVIINHGSNIQSILLLYIYTSWQNLPILSLIDSYDILITVLLVCPTWDTAFVPVCEQHKLWTDSDESFWVQDPHVLKYW